MLFNLFTYDIYNCCKIINNIVINTLLSYLFNFFLSVAGVSV